jgi:hypothetical protein
LAGLGGVFAKPEQVSDQFDKGMSLGSSLKGLGYAYMGIGGGAVVGGLLSSNPIGAGVAAAGAGLVVAGVITWAVGTAVEASSAADKPSAGGTAPAGTGTGTGSGTGTGTGTGSGSGTGGGTTSSTPSVDVHSLPDAKAGTGGKPNPNQKPNPMNYYPSSMDFYPGGLGLRGGYSHSVGITDVDTVGAFGKGLDAHLTQTGAKTYQLR